MAAATHRPNEQSFSDIREREGLLGLAIIAIDATRRVLPDIMQILRPKLESKAEEVIAEHVTAFANAPDVGALATLGSWYAYAAASDPDKLPYDLSFWRAAVSVVTTGLGTWLVARASRHAWKVFLVGGAVATAMSVVYTDLTDAYVTRTWKKGSTRDIIFNSVMPVAHGALGLIGLGAFTAKGEALVSRAARRVPTAIASRWPQLRSLGLYYMVFSLVGHWAEILFCLGIKHGIFDGEYDNGENKMLWDQWLFPFPAEGTAAVLVALFLHPFKEFVQHHSTRLVQAGTLSKFVALPGAVAITFLLNQLVCTSIDYTTGLVANRNYELWDYRDMPFNFQGQICLQNSLIYSAVATWAVWHLFPLMEKGMALAGDTVLDGAFVGLGSFFVFLELLYHVLPPKDDADEDGAAWPEDELASDEGIIVLLHEDEIVS